MGRKYNKPEILSRNQLSINEAVAACTYNLNDTGTGYAFLWSGGSWSEITGSYQGVFNTYTNDENLGYAYFEEQVAPNIIVWYEVYADGYYLLFEDYYPYEYDQATMEFISQQDLDFVGAASDNWQQVTNINGQASYSPYTPGQGEGLVYS